MPIRPAVRRVVFFTVLIALVLAGTVYALIYAQGPSPEGAATAPASTMMAQPASSEMMARMAKMAETRKAADARLDAVVATMNAARGTARTAAIAAAVTELAAQHTAMAKEMKSMCDDMMSRHAAGDAAPPAGDGHAGH